MLLKITLPILLLTLIGCSSTSSSIKKNKQHDSAVRNLLDGTWIVSKTDKTPIRKGLPSSKYYDYYSALHAHSIGCKSYSQVDIKTEKNEKAYKCMVNGTYVTEKLMAVGYEWQ